MGDAECSPPPAAGGGEVLKRHPSPRQTPDGRTLVSRHVVAYLGHRHIDVVRKRVPAVACDVTTRAVLVDLDEAEEILGQRQHRNRAALVPLRPE